MEQGDAVHLDTPYAFAYNLIKGSIFHRNCSAEREKERKDPARAVLGLDKTMTNRLTLTIARQTGPDMSVYSYFGLIFCKL